MKTSKIYSFSKEELQELVNNSNTIRECMKKCGLSSEGGNRKTLFRIFTEYNLDLSILKKNREFFLKERLKKGSKKIDENKIFCENSNYSNRTNIKRKLLEKKIFEYECSKCGNEGIWNNERLSLQLEHRNGINDDNRIENLCLLCPNCHSQSKTFCGRNTTKGIEKEKKKQEKEKRKQEKEKDLLKFKESFLEDVDIGKRGWVVKAAKKWNVSHTQIRRWYKKFAL